MSNTHGDSKKDGIKKNLQIITISDMINSIQHLDHVFMNGNYLIIHFHIHTNVI